MSPADVLILAVYFLVASTVRAGGLLYFFMVRVYPQATVGPPALLGADRFARSSPQDCGGKLIPYWMAGSPTFGTRQTFPSEPADQKASVVGSIASPRTSGNAKSDALDTWLGRVSTTDHSRHRAVGRHAHHDAADVAPEHHEVEVSRRIRRPPPRSCVIGVCAAVRLGS